MRKWIGVALALGFIGACLGPAPDKSPISPLVEPTFTPHVTETPLATTTPDVTPPATFTPRPTVTFTGTPRPTPSTLTVTPTPPRAIYLPAMMREWSELTATRRPTP